MREAIDYYDILRVPSDAEPAVIIAAFRRLARQYHPDVNPDPAAHEQMRQLNEAFEVLGDPRQRAQYDRERRWSGFVVTPPGSSFTPPTFIPPTAQSIGVWARLSQLRGFRVTIAGAVGLTIVTMAAMATQFGSESGAGGQSSLQSVERAGLSLSPDSVRAEGVYAPSSAPARPGETPMDTPGTRRDESDGTASPTNRPPARPGESQPLLPGVAPSVAGASSPPNATSTGGAIPTPKPGSPKTPTPAPTSGPPTAGPPTAGPPTPTPDPPTATPPPGQCAAAGTPSWNDHGSQVRFWYGTVVSYQPGDPGLLIVDVAGTVLRFLISQGTEVLGDLSTATVVSGRGVGSPDIDVDAKEIEVVCP